MQINFSQELKSIEGDDIPFRNRPKTLLKDLAIDTLQAMFDDERNLAGEEKAKRWVLATRIYANPEGVDLELEEIVLVKKLIGKAYGPCFVGQAFDMLEGRTNSNG